MANPIFQEPRQKKIPIACTDPPCSEQQVDKATGFIIPRQEEVSQKQNLFVNQEKTKQNLFVDQGKTKQNLFSVESQLKECTKDNEILNLRIAELLSENAELKSRTNKIEIEEAATKITSFVRKSLSLIHI